MSVRRVTHCIFNLEGTLISTEKIYHSMLEEICKKRGKQFPSELQCRNYEAPDHILCLCIIKALNINAKVCELESQLVQLGATRLPDAPLRLGAQQLVEHLHSHKIPMGLTSNKTSYIITNLIQRKSNFFKMFEHITTIDQVYYKGKPQPDQLLCAAYKFKPPPSPDECLVFEHNTAGLCAALSANMQVVLIPNRNVIERQFMNKNSRLIQDLCEFRPEYYGMPSFNEKPAKSKSSVTEEPPVAILRTMASDDVYCRQYYS